MRPTQPPGTPSAAFFAAGGAEPYTDAATTTKTSTTGNPDDRNLFVQFTG